MLSREIDDNNIPVGDNAPQLINFITSTIQKADQGVIVDRGDSIKFDNCWFEDIHKAVLVKTSDKKIKECFFN